MEDDLFRALEFRKPREFPWDAVALGVVVAAIALFYAGEVSVLSAVYGTVAFGVLVYGFLRRWR